VWIKRNEVADLMKIYLTWEFVLSSS